MSSQANIVDGPAARTIRAIAKWRPPGPRPLVVAIDGHGASGKSTIAGEVAESTGAALVHMDDFFNSTGAVSAHSEGVDRYYDCHRLRVQALEPLRAGRSAHFERFTWSRVPTAKDVVTIQPSDLIIVEGVFAAAPELDDLVDRSVLVQTPKPERLRRLHIRVSTETWDSDWLIAEQAYFDVRSAASFDLLVAGTNR